MTPVATKTAASHTVAQTPAELLRDAAFVLMMTKRVKDAILGKGAEPSEAGRLAARRRTAAGVIAA
jgi:hypothetical protein